MADGEMTVSFRTRVLATAFIYLLFAAASITVLAINAAHSTPDSRIAASVVVIVTAGLHILASLWSSMVPHGRTAWRVRALWAVVASDNLQAGALGAVVAGMSVVDDVGDMKEGIAIVAPALVAFAQLACLIKTAELLDTDLWDPDSGERLADDD